MLNGEEFYEGLFEKIYIVSPTVEIDKSTQLDLLEEVEDLCEIKRYRGRLKRKSVNHYVVYTTCNKSRGHSAVVTAGVPSGPWSDVTICEEVRFRSVVQHIEDLYDVDVEFIALPNYI